MVDLRPGLRRVDEYEVREEHAAPTLLSRGVGVLSTPAMIAMMESTARLAVADALPPGHETVGVRVDVRHLAPAPLGSRVRVEAELVGVEGRRLVFRVRASLGGRVIGEGTHERYIVDLARFSDKVRMMRLGRDER